MIHQPDWEPINFVMEGKAAYNVMGDWAIAAFKAANKEMGKDWMWAPVPGTQGMFDFLADSFTMPKGAKNPEGTSMVAIIASAEGQSQFNMIKGSIPARTDVDVTKFPEYQQKAMEDFKSKGNCFFSSTWCSCSS